MTGQIEGGWAFVAAAWGISLGIFVVYAALNEWRLRRIENEAP